MDPQINNYWDARKVPLILGNPHAAWLHAVSSNTGSPTKSALWTALGLFSYEYGNPFGIIAKPERNLNPQLGLDKRNLADTKACLSDSTCRLQWKCKLKRCTASGGCGKTSRIHRSSAQSKHLLWESLQSLAWS